MSMYMNMIEVYWHERLCSPFWLTLSCVNIFEKLVLKASYGFMTIDFPLNMHWPKAYIGSHHFRYIHRRYNFKIVWITFSTNSKPMQLYPLKNLNIFTRTIHYRLGRKKGVCNGTASTKNKINLDQEVILLFKCTCIYYKEMYFSIIDHSQFWISWCKIIFAKFANLRKTIQIGIAATFYEKRIVPQKHDCCT